MKKLVLTPIVLLLIFLACGNANKLDETPVAFNDSTDFLDASINYSKRGSSLSLIEELFDEYLETDEVMADKLEAFGDMLRKDNALINKYGEFIRNQNNYHSLAQQRLEMIKDTVLKKEVAAELKDVRERWVMKKNKIGKQIDAINEARNKVDDQVHAIKLYKTMAIMDGYAGKKDMGADRLKKLITKYQEVRSELDSDVSS